MNDEIVERYVESLEGRVDNNQRKADRFELSDSREMMKFYRGIAIGRQRSADELKQMLEDNE